MAYSKFAFFFYSYDGENSKFCFIKRFEIQSSQVKAKTWTKIMTICTLNTLSDKAIWHVLSNVNMLNNADNYRFLPQ